jgi:general stress protein 26
MKKTTLKLSMICNLMILVSILPVSLFAQTTVSKSTLLIAAHEIITESTYCGLATVDSSGQPKVRTMNPFPANDDFITWFATARNSQKIAELKNNPKVSVYYANHIAAKGYVNITGIAEVIDDKELLTKMKRDYWDNIPNWQTEFVLIKITPKTLDVINYNKGINNDPKTLKAPSIVF